MPAGMGSRTIPTWRQGEEDEVDLDEERRAPDERDVERCGAVDVRVRDSRPSAPMTARMVARMIETVEIRMVRPVPPRMYEGPLAGELRIGVPGRDDGEADDPEDDRPGEDELEPERVACRPLGFPDLPRIGGSTSGAAASRWWPSPRSFRMQKRDTGTSLGRPRVRDAGSGAATGLGGQVLALEPLLAERRQRAVGMHVLDDLVERGLQLGVRPDRPCRSPPRAARRRPGRRR